MAGGLIRRSGVLDALRRLVRPGGPRPRGAELEEQGTGLVRALTIGFGLVFSLVTLVFALWHREYYDLLTSVDRVAHHQKHDFLRPGPRVRPGASASPRRC